MRSLPGVCLWLSAVFCDLPLCRGVGGGESGGGEVGSKHVKAAFISVCFFLRLLPCYCFCICQPCKGFFNFTFSASFVFLLLFSPVLLPCRRSYMCNSVCCFLVLVSVKIPERFPSCKSSVGQASCGRVTLAKRMK